MALAKMTNDDRQRIDKWLWFARIAKSRTLAQKLAMSGRVRVNRERHQSASRLIRTGDILTIALDFRRPRPESGRPGIAPRTAGGSPPALRGPVAAAGIARGRRPPARPAGERPPDEARAPGTACVQTAPRRRNFLSA